MLTGLALGAAFFFIAGCGSQAEALTKQQVACMQELNDILKTVQNDQTAIDAKPKLQAVSEKMRGLKAEQEKLALSTEKTLELDKKYGDAKSISELKNESERISNLKLKQANFDAIMNALGSPSYATPAPDPAPAAPAEQNTDPAANPFEKPSAGTVEK